MKMSKIEPSDSPPFLEEFEVPEGWLSTSVGKLFQIVGGGTPSTKNPEFWGGDIPWISSADIYGLKKIVPRRTINQIAIKNSAAHLVPKGSIIVVTRVNLGRIAISKSPISFSQDCHALIPKTNSIYPEFALYYLSQAVQSFKNQSRGTTISGVTVQVVSSIPFPLPPFAEQQCIVAHIEALLVHVNAARDRLNRVPLIMKRFRQAVLAAACSGRLTEGWREEHPRVECGAELLNKILKERRFISENNRFTKNTKRKYCEPLAPSSLDSSIIPDTWQWATFDQITSLITKGSSPSWQGFDYLDTGIRFVRSQNIQWGNLNLDEIAYLSPKYNEIHQRSIIRENDILLNLVGASIGRSAIATKTIDGANCNQAVGIIRLVDEFLSNKFVLFYLLSPHSQDYIHDTKSDSARANFNLDDVRPTPIPLPPLAEQHEIVRRVGMLFERADAIDREVAVTNQRCERLTQAVLVKAFRGELVPSGKAKGEA